MFFSQATVPGVNGFKSLIRRGTHSHKDRSLARGIRIRPAQGVRNGLLLLAEGIKLSARCQLHDHIGLGSVSIKGVGSHEVCQGLWVEQGFAKITPALVSLQA